MYKIKINKNMTHLKSWDILDKWPDKFKSSIIFSKFAKFGTVSEKLIGLYS